MARTPDVDTRPNPDTPPAGSPSTPPPSTGGPTGNSGFAMQPSTMDTLQGRAGDLGSRLSGLAGELRGLRLSPTSLGPVGLAMVPILNASNDNAVAQADRGATAFGNIQSGLRATHVTAADTDTHNAATLTAIDPTTTPPMPKGVGARDWSAGPSALPGPAPTVPTVNDSLPPVTPRQQTALDLHGLRLVEVRTADPRDSLVEAMARTVAPDSPEAQRKFTSDVGEWTSRSSTIDDLAAAGKVRVHVLGPDGTFTSHGPVTGTPVHVVEVKGPRYHATTEDVHIGRPGIAYPGPTTVAAHGSKNTVHRGEFEIETIAGRHHVRVYTAVVNPASFDMTDPSRPTSAFKDIQQDPTTGRLNISTGSNAQLWAGAGRPQRALQWLAKYDHTDGGQPINPKNPVELKRPVLRSFLVPLDTFNKITSGATVEGAPGSTSKTHTYNVDQRGEPNQFGIGGEHLAELVKHAEPGSLISYPAHTDASFAHADLAGRITPTSELYQRLGLSPDFRSDAVGKAYDPWFSWTRQPDGSWRVDGFRNDAHRLHQIATQLREHHLTWQQSTQDPARRGSDALIEPDADTIPNARPGTGPDVNRDLGFDARTERLNRFLNEVGPASVNVDKISTEVLSTGPGALRDYLANHGAPAADQTAFRQVMSGHVVPDAVREATRAVDGLVKTLKGPVATRAELEQLVAQGFRPKSGPVRQFGEHVIDKAVDQFVSNVEQHPDLALLTDDSRGAAAGAMRDRVKQAMTAEFGNLANLEPLAKGRKKDGWLSGPRLAEFGRRVAERVAAQPLSDIEAAVDPAKLADVARRKVLGDVVTRALDGFTGQDLANTSPDRLRSVVVDNVLPTLSTDIATALREHPALSLADQGFRDSMADTVARDARVRAEQALSGFTFQPVDPAEVETLMTKVPEIATQAEIGALISADSDRIALDFNTRSQEEGPFPNAYHQWNTERAETVAAQHAIGEELSRSINTPTRDAHAVVDQLIERFPELNRKFDEVTTAPQLEPYRKPGATDRFTFYEHAQMVLGQYLKLTDGENPANRLIPADALAKAILFHDIEKNNAKNQFGDGQGQHDREPEHKLAVQLMDRYRGLWADEREFAAARAIVDSDPFGFYLRGKITADEAFTFLHDLAARIGGPDPANARKLFDEFHQYYQADFSSYTTHSGYTDRDGNAHHGPNSFTNRFQPGAGGIQTTSDGRHFEYAEGGDAARRMRELTDMFRDPATITSHRERLLQAQQVTV